VEFGLGLPADRATEVAAQLDAVYPGLSASKTREARQVRLLSARPVDVDPGSGARGRGQSPFRGEHCSLDAQGFMEGGCGSGERAAAEVLVALRHPALARAI
jgi:monoamine oxidase